MEGLMWADRDCIDQVGTGNDASTRKARDEETLILNGDFYQTATAYIYIYVHDTVLS